MWLCEWVCVCRRRRWISTINESAEYVIIKSSSKLHSIHLLIKHIKKSRFTLNEQHGFGYIWKVCARVTQKVNEDEEINRNISVCPNKTKQKKSHKSQTNGHCKLCLSVLRRKRCNVIIESMKCVCSHRHEDLAIVLCATTKWVELLQLRILNVLFFAVHYFAYRKTTLSFWLYCSPLYNPPGRLSLLGKMTRGVRDDLYGTMRRERSAWPE